MKRMPILSLCMPTNGVIEWVFPVLDSIFVQNCDPNKFEVIITDNGNNLEFKERIKTYIRQYANIRYYETNALPFLNEIESYKRATGELIKFVNHRTKLVEGALEKLILYAEANVNNRPITYFSNGVIGIEKTKHIYSTFDEFVKNLSYWSSWSTGITIWKNDFVKLPEDVSSFNELFPHTNVLFAERDKGEYVIDNTKIFDEMPQGKKTKGKYDLFFAFGVEYPSIILNLYKNNDISANTYKSVLYDNLKFIAELYFIYFIKKEYCSYDLRGLTDMYGVFYSKKEVQKEVLKIVLSRGIKKIKRRLKR